MSKKDGKFRNDEFRNDFFQGLDKRKGIDIGIKINAGSRKSAVLIIIVGELEKQNNDTKFCIKIRI